MHLAIRGVSKTYTNGVRALRDVTLDIPRGMYGLLGPNGAGKSTLMRTIATLQEPDTGSITLGDIDVVREKERVRFLNLLSEIGERAVVILSTHLVEDVAELCSRMAIIDRGEIRLESEPLAAIAALRGRVWRRFVAKAELPEVERSHRVICTKLQSGRTLVRVYAESHPGPDFEPAEPDLEDVYFSVMAGHQGALAGVAS